MAEWKNRIVGHDEVDPKSLIANPRNWRGHGGDQRQAIDGILSSLGWIQNIVVNKTTGNMIDGHMRAQEAAQRGETTVPVTYVELTEEEEAIAIATFDAVGHMANPNTVKLESLLEEVSVTDPRVNIVLDTLRFDLEAAKVLQRPTETRERKPTESGNGGEKVEILQFSVVFNSQEEQQTWYAFLSWLKTKYETTPTVAERLIEFINEHGFVEDAD